MKFNGFFLKPGSVTGSTAGVVPLLEAKEFANGVKVQVTQSTVGLLKALSETIRRSTNVTRKW
jgi:hypothetical protein